MSSSDTDPSNLNYLCTLKSLAMFRLCLLLYLFALIAISCQEKLPAEMIALEKEVAVTPTNANVTQLLDLYSSWLQENPGVTPARKAILEKQLAVSTEHIRYTHALSALHGLIIDYHDDTKTSDRLLQIGEILTKMNKTVATQVLYQSFVSTYPDHAKTQELKTQYSSTVPVDTFIRNVGLQIYTDSTATINEIVARQYVDACEAYALVHHGSDQSAEYLHKASEMARTTRSIPKALSIYDWLLRAYPNHKRSAQALFLKGFTYDNDLKDFETAKVVYTEFLEKYPNDEFAPSARFLLENIGKSDDELLEALQKKAAENQNQ